VALQNKYVNARGAEVRYTVADLRYDMDAGILRESREFDVRNAEWLTEDTAFVMSETAKERAVRYRTAHITRRRKDGKPSKARLLSSCAPAAYRNRHPLTALRACAADERCRYLGPGKGHHCVTRKRATVSPIVAHDTRYDRGETDDLSAFLCVRLGLRWIKIERLITKRNLYKKTHHLKHPSFEGYEEDGQRGEAVGALPRAEVHEAAGPSDITKKTWLKKRNDFFWGMLP
jgi:hypothetical protein